MRPSNSVMYTARDYYAHQIMGELNRAVKILLGLIWIWKNIWKKAVGQHASLHKSFHDIVSECASFVFLVLLIKEQKYKILKYLCRLSLFPNWLSTSWTARVFLQPLIDAIGMKSVISLKGDYLWRLFFAENWDVLFQNIVLQTNWTLK